MKISRGFGRALFWLFSLIALPCFILTVMGFRQGFGFELSSHFRLIYLVVGLGFLGLTIVGQFFLRLPRWIFLFLVAVAILSNGLNLSTIMPFYSAKPKVGDTQLVRKFKILHINVLGVNQNTKAVADLIRTTQPDILTLAEYSPRWRNQLEQSGVLKRFQSAYVVKYGNDGIYSTIPFQNVQVSYVKPGKDQTTQVHFALEKIPVTLLLLHPRPPVKLGWYERNRAHFEYLEQYWHQYGSNVLMVGDLNNSPWSYTFRHFLSVSGLKDSQVGFGLQPSWPVLIPERGIDGLIPMIPIDHVLYSDRFVVLSRQTGLRIGSDHLPVIVEMGLRR